MTKTPNTNKTANPFHSGHMRNLTDAKIRIQQNLFFKFSLSLSTPFRCTSSFHRSRPRRSLLKEIEVEGGSGRLLQSVESNCDWCQCGIRVPNPKFVARSAEVE
ncbi:hypothetical protein VNO80_09051 [Phaseolus coccineus]|uniref:Uncharacterized protein n=1 Tax=Phaseolus coccineus TaxID=3886 RepID=A0AAN9N5L6_PHACN